MKPIRIGSASRIEIGYDGENGARAVVFDATKWMEEMPGCTAAITAQRADGQEYIAPDVTQDEAEKTITWTLTSAETMEGEGRAQLLWMDGERVAKQAIFTTVCHESLKSDATQIGVPEPVWAQQSLAAAQEARKSAEAAKASEIGAQNVLEETKGVLDAATGNIVDVGKRADAAQTKAEKNERDIGQLKADMNGKMDLGDWEKGFVSATGVETSNNYTWRTGKIPVSPLAPYKIVVVNHNGYIIRKFNASDEIIGSVSQTGSTSTETIKKTIWLNDDGISYIRMCVTSQDNTNYPANGENVSLFLSVNEQYCRNYGEVTPEMFGAVGDGVTNDTTALQACIDYAALNGVSVKSVKGRKYKVTQITINKPVDIDLGWATIISGSASSTVIVNRTTNAAYGNTRVNGTLRRVIFDGNLVSNGILYVSNDIRGVYEDLIIQNMGKKTSSSGRTDEDKGTENLSRGIVYAAKPGKGGGNYFRRIYGQMQPNYGSYDTLLIDVMGSDSTFQNIDYQHIKYGIRITGGAFVDNFHGYITSRSIYPGSYCMRVGKNGSVIASQYYPDTQQYGTIVNNDGKPVIINGGTSYFSPDSEIATSGAVSEYPPYLFYGANSDQLAGVNVCGMHFNAPADDNGKPYTYTLCNVDTQLKIINAVYNNIIGQQKDDIGQIKDDLVTERNRLNDFKNELNILNGSIENKGYSYLVAHNLTEEFSLNGSGNFNLMHFSQQADLNIELNKDYLIIANIDVESYVGNVAYSFALGLRDGYSLDYAYNRLYPTGTWYPSKTDTSIFTFGIVKVNGSIAKARPWLRVSNAGDNGNYTFKVKNWALMEYDENMNIDAIAGLFKNNTFAPDITWEYEKKNIYCWGDSLTMGAGGNGVSYPSVLQNLLGYKYKVYNMGVGGESGDTIACRQGGMVAYLDADTTFTANASVDFKASTVYGVQINPSRQVGDIDGMILGNRGVVGWNNTTSMSTFTSEKTFTAKKGTPILIVQKMENPYMQIICLGQNGVGGVNVNPQAETNWKTWCEVIDAMQNYTDAHTIVLSLLDGDISYDTTVDLYAQKKYGGRYIESRQELSKYGMNIVGRTPTSDDTERMNAEKVPTSLFSDSVHLNADGYTAWATIIYWHLKGLGLVD